LVIDVALLGTISYYPILLLSRVPFGIENFVPWILYFDLGILIFLISLLVLTWVVKILLLGRIVKAVVSNKSIWYFRWLIFDYLWSLVNFFLLHILSGTIWLNFIYRCFGASIGEGTFIEKPCIRVPDLVHIGSNTYISGEATILCVNENPDSSAFGTVRIGNGSVIQSRAFLDINVIIGNQVEVCPLTHIAPDTKVQSGSRVSGTLAQVDKIDHELLHNVSSSQIDAKGGFYVGLVTPVIICILYGVLLGAFIFSFEPIYLATEEDLGISVVIYLACGPLIGKCASSLPATSIPTYSLPDTTFYLSFGGS
jgi:acetyltransferase-like isoleucine patch superfamily enzyme